MKTHDLFVGFVIMDCLHIALGFVITFSHTYIMYFSLRKEIRAQSKSSGILGRQTFRVRYQQVFGFKGKLNLYYTDGRVKRNYKIHLIFPHHKAFVAR